jgi:hypothetical protein
MRVQVGMEGSGDWWSVVWHCPGDSLCGYQRTFDTEAKASAFIARIKAEGCPNSPWFHDETENRDAS